MNSRNFKTIMLLATCVLLLGSVAKAQDLHLKAQVPFDFKVGEMTMPTGTYELTRIHDNTNRAFRIRGENAGMLKVMAPAYNKRTPEKNLLIFNKYQGTGGEVSYFLTKIRLAGEETGYDIGTTRAEQAAAARAARRDIITLVVERVKGAAE